MIRSLLAFYDQKVLLLVRSFSVGPCWLQAMVWENNGKHILKT
jgi:hypothetical protein